MCIKPDLMTVLQGRMVAILHLMEQFTDMYEGQESHAKLLDAVRGGIRKLEPVFRMLPQKIKANAEGCAAEVIGEHAVEVCQLCANAGWFVAEIESVISDTSCELNPEMVDDPPFLIPESFPAEQLKILREIFDAADTEFSERINVDFTPKDGMVNPFGL